MGKRILLKASGLLILFNAGNSRYADASSGKAASTGKAAPPTPDDPSAGWDLLWGDVLLDLTVIAIIFSVVTLCFIFKYRRKRPDQEGTPVRLSRGAMIGWALIPAFIFLADDLYLALKGWDLFNDYRTVPAERLEIKLESRMWNWFFTYPNGVQTVDELRVPVGKPVLVTMKSADVVHSLFIPDFRVKEDSMPGRITYLWFYPKKAGEHVFTCAEYCGLLHSRMKGRLIVMDEDEFSAWLEKENSLEGS